MQEKVPEGVILGKHKEEALRIYTPYDFLDTVETDNAEMKDAEAKGAESTEVKDENKNT